NSDRKTRSWTMSLGGRPQKAIRKTRPWLSRSLPKTDHIDHPEETLRVLPPSHCL
ncbi:hypothetical protein BaRGS_00028280, partial [Batillaria attramentaria]